jgi:hypothetical protein
MEEDPFRDWLGKRHQLGVALAEVRTPDGGVAMLHSDTSGHLWLVERHDDVDGGDLSATRSAGRLITSFYDDILIVGGRAEGQVRQVQVRLRDDRARRVTPGAHGGWLTAMDGVTLPTFVTVSLRGASGELLSEETLDFPDFRDPVAAGPITRLVRSVRLHVDLPGPLGLPRGRTTYPAAGWRSTLSRF